MNRMTTAGEKRSSGRIVLGCLAAGALLLWGTRAALGSAADDQRAVAALDTRYQAAVKANQAQTMGEILDDRFVLVLGNGRTVSRADLLDDVRKGKLQWDHQEEEPGSQTVRVWGDTAVVTAKLWEAGREDGKAFDSKLWFSDTYARTPQGWRYVFGQASLALPASR